MRISNSKKQLAKIIHENGGWRDGADTCSCDNDGYVNFFVGKPTRSGVSWIDNGDCEYVGGIITPKYEKIKNWHQTILSRDEYFHLYPAPDADGWIEWEGGECPVKQGTLVDIKDADGAEWLAVKADPQDEYSDASNVFWEWNCTECNRIVAYRLHKPNLAETEFCESVTRSIQEPSNKPTIEQLAADYRNRKDYADRKQDEADAAKADAEAKLEELVAVGKAIGLVLSFAEPEPELVITDWRDLRVGDELTALRVDNVDGADGERCVVVKTQDNANGVFVLAKFGNGDTWWVRDWRFIRRP